MPPFAKVKNLVKALCLIEQLAFVDEQSGIASIVLHCLDDLIERHDLIFDVWVKNSQREKCARQGAGHCDLELWQLRESCGLARNRDRSIVVPNRGSVRQKRILVSNVC